MRHSFWIVFTSVLFTATFAGGAHAQSNYPAKPIRLIVPLAPGGPSDILARTMAVKMSEGLKPKARNSSPTRQSRPLR